jgi:hypothetical protein
MQFVYLTGSHSHSVLVDPAAAGCAYVAEGACAAVSVCTCCGWGLCCMCLSLPCICICARQRCGCAGHECRLVLALALIYVLALRRREIRMDAASTLAQQAHILCSGMPVDVDAPGAFAALFGQMLEHGQSVVHGPPTCQSCLQYRVEWEGCWQLVCCKLKYCSEFFSRKHFKG